MKIIILIVAAAAASAVSLHGQPPPPGSHLAVRIPFAFHKVNQAMPAGTYEMKPGLAGSVIMSNAEINKASALLFTYRLPEPSINGSLRFLCYDGETGDCFLREFVAPGSSFGVTFPAGKLEKEHMRGQAARVAKLDLSRRSDTAAGE